jgi:acetoin utilization deacetylase AcuC-like enzyme
LILVSAGIDIYINDPLGGMRVTPRGFAGLTRSIMDISNECCDGKMVMTLEGGYNLQGLSDSVKEILKEMAGLTTTDKSSILDKADQNRVDRLMKHVAQVHCGFWKGLIASQ